MTEHTTLSGDKDVVVVTPVEAVLRRLEQVRKAPGSRWTARCPAHPDRSPSLSIKEGSDGRALLYCFAGCSTPDVVAALGLAMRDLFPKKQSLSYPP